MSPLNPSTPSANDSCEPITGEATAVEAIVRRIDRRASRKQRRMARQKARQGVVLLLVVTLLVMFLLIGVTGVIVATAYHTGSKAAARMTRTEVRHEDFTDRILLQLLRGTDSRSALYGHDLLGDLYGNDGISGTVQGTQQTTLNPNRNATDPQPPYDFDNTNPTTRGQLIDINVNLVVTPTTYFFNADHFVGRVFTLVDGPSQGKSSRILKFDAVNIANLTDGTPGQNVQYRLVIDALGGVFSSNITGNRFVINGQPFSGTGAGYKTNWSLDELGTPRDPSHMYPDIPATLNTLNQVQPFDHDQDASTPATQIHTYLLPNYRAYNLANMSPAVRDALRPDLGGLDEPHDSVSLQDMALSWSPSNVSASTPIIPSFYRYQLFRYLRDVVFDSTRDPTLGANFLDTPYSGLTPVQRYAFWNVMNRAVLRPLPIPSTYPISPAIPSHVNFTGGNSTFTLNPASTLRQYLSQLAGEAGPGSQPFLLDADTDGDQVLDSVWVDPGLPVQTARDGRRYKILAAIQVRDLNGHLNVNTMTSGPVIASVLQPPEVTDPTLAAKLAVTMPVGRGSGFGPAEITPLNTSTSTDVPLLNDTRPLLVGTLVPSPVLGRYGDAPITAVPGAPFATRSANDATNLIPKLKAPAPYTTTDLLGLGQLGFDHDGQPVHVFQTLALSSLFARPEGSPYAFDPLRRNQKFDLPFTEAEIERMLRKVDVDGSINPNRLQVLASTTAFGVDPMTGNAAAQGSIRSLTSISVHVPTASTLPPAEFRRMGATSIGSSTNSNYSSQIFNRVLLALIAADPGNAMTTLQQKQMAARNSINMLVPFEVRHGYPMNVNRPFGNGADENSNGIIDETLLVGGVVTPEDLGGRAFVDTNRPVDGAGNNSIRDDFPQYGSAVSSFTNGENALGNGNVVDPRVLYARHLYCSAAFALANNGANEFQYASLSSDRRALTLRRLAQWAINCAEFRDPDGIMTAFEYDANPFDGWNVNGDPKTMVDAMGNTVLGTEAVAGLVWGCEQPELLLTESIAFHNRGVADTADDTDDPVRVQKSRTSSSNPDDDLDQVRFPQGSLYLELYAPRPRPATNPVNLVQFNQFPPELYNVNVATGAAALALDRLAPQQPGVAGTVRPVWRVFISKVLRDNSMNRQTQPGANINDAVTMSPIYTPRDLFTDANNSGRDDATYQPDSYLPYGIAQQPTLDDQDYREVWFSNVDPSTIGISTADAQHIFYNRQSTSNALEPGRYLVLGPRATTHLGDSSPQTIQFKPRSAFPSMNVSDDLEVFVTDTAGAKTGAGVAPLPTDFTAGSGNVQPMETMICASNPPTAWTGSMNPSVVVIPGGTPAIGMNISLPLVESNPTYWSAIHEPNGANERFVDPMDSTTSLPLDTPFDEQTNSQLRIDGILVQDQKSTGTWQDVRTAFLQRLANPLLPWNPIPGKAGHNTNLPLNPYLTVDWMPLDLTVFNGEDQEPSSFMGIWDPYDNTAAMGPEFKLQTRERGANQQALPWTFDTTVRANASPPAGNSQNPDCDLVHSLGYLNVAMGGATRKSNMGVAAAIYNGSPPTPFPWITWYNHAFNSPGEVMLVPATSAGRLFHEYGDIQKVAGPPSENDTSTGGGVYRPQVGGAGESIRSVSADYSNAIGSAFPSGGYLPFPHLLNFFQKSQFAPGSSSYSNSEFRPDLSRLLDLLGMPGPFFGAEQWYNPSNFSEANNAILADGYRPPFNYLPNFREAGRLNLNTLSDYYDGSDSPPFPPQTAAWDALTANLPFNSATNTGSPSFQLFNQSRRGTGISLSPAQTPELINNPFRPANAADLMPNFSLPVTGVNGDPSWNGADLSQLGTSEVGLLRRDPAPSPPQSNRPLFHLPTDANVPANPATRLHAMNRLFNLTTNQANSFAVWITLGKFEVEYNSAYVGSPQIPDGYTLGAELGFEDGTQQRHRSFFIIDRTKPVAYETGKNHNAAECILLRRVLE